MTLAKSRKTVRLRKFIDGLEKHIDDHPRLPTNSLGKKEASIQGQLFSIFVEYLEGQYQKNGVASYREKAASSFYWEGQANKGNRKSPLEFFASKNYPDFVIQSPYSIAIEYKQSKYGSLIKQAIGQSMVHILNQEYSYVYILFNDQNKDKRIKKSLRNAKEKSVCSALWENFNIKLHVI